MYQRINYEAKNTVAIHEVHENDWYEICAKNHIITLTIQQQLSLFSNIFL